MVIDASVAFKWLFIENDSDKAAAIIGRDDLRAPSLLLAEIGNALWKKGMRGELGDHTAYATQVGLIGSLVETVPEADVMPRALEMALTLKHVIYDRVYLALAERLNDRLLTADERFTGRVNASPYAPLIEALV